MKMLLSELNKRTFTVVVEYKHNLNKISQACILMKKIWHVAIVQDDR